MASNHICARVLPCDACERMAARREKVAEMTQVGMSASQIAADLKVTQRTVVRDRVELGIAQPKAPLFTPEEHERALQMLEDGAPYTEVARTIGRSVAAVQQRYCGMSQVNGGQLARLNDLRRQVGLL